MSLSAYSKELIATANILAVSGKGILAVDESTKTIGKRLSAIQVENTEANRQAYRGMLFTTAGLGALHQWCNLSTKRPCSRAMPTARRWFRSCSKAGNVIPGIKVDQGLRPLARRPGSVETLCTGLDGLVERAADYYAQGARFAKWRAVLQITADGCPSDLSPFVKMPGA